MRTEIREWSIRIDSVDESIRSQIQIAILIDSTPENAIDKSVICGWTVNMVLRNVLFFQFTSGHHAVSMDLPCQLWELLFQLQHYSPEAVNNMFFCFSCFLPLV